MTVGSDLDAILATIPTDLSAYATKAYVDAAIAALTPAAPPVTPFVVGPAIFGSSKSNQQVGGTDRRRVAHLFRADRTDTIVGIRQSFRGGTGGYSNGSGGTIKLSVQTVTGTTPSGTPLGTTGNTATHVPGNPGAWTTYPELLLNVPVTTGQLVAAVYEDIDAAQDTNFCSLNELFNWGALVPRQPRFADSDYGVLVSINGGPWTVDAQHTPTMDVRYSNGHHQGQGYVGMIGGIAPNTAQNPLALPISGNSKVKSTWQNDVPVTLSELGTFVRRDHGTDPLFITVRQGTNTLFEVQVPATSIPIATNSGADAPGLAVAKATSTPLLIPAGALEVRLSAAATSLYTVCPIRDGTDVGFDASVCWAPGSAFYCTDGGTVWTPVYSGSICEIPWYGR